MCKSELFTFSDVLRRWMMLQRVGLAKGTRIAKLLDRDTWNAAGAELVAAYVLTAWWFATSLHFRV